MALLKDATLLIDGDILLYRAASACERDVRWDDVNHVLVSNADEAWDAVKSQLDHYRRELGDHPMYFALTGSSNFRRTLYPEYKGGRTRKPLCYGALVERLTEEHGAKTVDCLEADDLLGIWATQGKISNPVIVSLDKDLRTIPATIWSPGVSKDKPGGLLEVSQFEADYRWLTQTLTGDVTDGYSGLPGCGPKTAERAFAVVSPMECDTPGEYAAKLWDAVVAAYEAKGLTVEDALLQARLARILRAEDWDAKAKEPILWNPANEH